MIVQESGRDINGFPWQTFKVQRSHAPKGYVHLVELGAMYASPRTHVSRDGYAMTVEHWADFGYSVSVDTRKVVR